MKMEHTQNYGDPPFAPGWQHPENQGAGQPTLPSSETYFPQTSPSGYAAPNHYYGESLGWSPIGGPTGQNVQGSYRGGFDYNQVQQHGTESITYQSGLYGKRASLRFRSVIDNQEAGRDVDDQSHHPTTLNTALQRLNYRENILPYTSQGIDPSLIGGSYHANIRDFNEAADGTDAAEGGTHNERLPRNFDHTDDHPPTGTSPPILTRSDTVSGTAFHAASSTASCSSRGTRTSAPSRATYRTDQPDPSQTSGTTCDICDRDPNCEKVPTYTGTAESQKTSLNRHKLYEHPNGQIPYFRCSIDVNGSPCGKTLSRIDNRKRHIQTKHPTKNAILLRSSKSETKALLDQWVPKLVG